MCWLVGWLLFFFFFFPFLIFLIFFSRSGLSSRKGRGRIPGAHCAACSCLQRGCRQGAARVEPGADTEPRNGSAPSSAAASRYRGAGEARADEPAFGRRGFSTQSGRRKRGLSHACAPARAARRRQGGSGAGRRWAARRQRCSLCLRLASTSAPAGTLWQPPGVSLRGYEQEQE